MFIDILGRLAQHIVCCVLRSTGRYTTVVRGTVFDVTFGCTLVDAGCRLVHR